MISRNRSKSTAAAMSIDRTTSANSTVTCLYSAGVVAVGTAAPHSLQNFEFGGNSIPHDPHTKSAAVMSRGQPTVVPRHYRVSACQPACARSPLRSATPCLRAGSGPDSADYDPRSTEVLVGAGLLIGDERGWLLVDFEDTQTNRDEMQALKPIRASNRARKARERANKQNVSADNTALHQTHLSSRLRRPAHL